MPGPDRPKKIPIERTSFRATIPFSFTPPSPSLLRQGEKKGHPQSPPKNENQKPAKKTIKPTTITDSMPSILFPPLSPEQYLQKALESLTQAYKGLDEKEKEKKEQVKQLEDYTQSILAGEKPFTQGKEKANNVLKGLVKEVRALCKEVAPTKETYAERLKRDLPSLSSLPSLLSPSPTPSPSSRSSTSTRSKKKQLILITDKKD